MNQSLILTIVDLIEDSLPQQLSIERLAKQCGFSRSHIQRQFKAATGYSISYYQRARLLSLAAMRLAEGEQRILDVAIEFGFESQEAFARAFRQHAATTPSRVLGKQIWARRIHFERLDQQKLTLLQRCQSLPIKITDHQGGRWGCYVFSVDSCERDILEVSEAIERAYRELAQHPFSKQLDFDQSQMIEFREHGQQAGSTYPMSIAFPFEDNQDIPEALVEIHLPSCQLAEISLPDPSYISVFFHPFYDRIFHDNECYFGGLPAFWHYDQRSGELHHRCQVEAIEKVKKDPVWQQLDDKNLTKLSNEFASSSVDQIPTSKRAGTRRLSTLLRQLDGEYSINKRLDIAFHSPEEQSDKQYHYSFGKIQAKGTIDTSHHDALLLEGDYLSTHWQGTNVQQLENELERFYLRLSQHTKYQYRPSAELFRFREWNENHIEFELLTPVERRATQRQKSIWTVE